MDDTLQGTHDLTLGCYVDTSGVPVETNRSVVVHELRVYPKLLDDEFVDLFLDMSDKWIAPVEVNLPRPLEVPATAWSMTPQLSSAVLWLDASDASTLFTDADGTLAMTGKSTETALQRWNSRATAVYNYAAINPANSSAQFYMPGLVNGRGAVHAKVHTSAGLALLLNIPRPLSGCDAFSLFIVMNATPVSPGATQRVTPCPHNTFSPFFVRGGNISCSLFCEIPDSHTIFGRCFTRPCSRLFWEGEGTWFGGVFCRGKKDWFCGCVRATTRARRHEGMQLPSVQGLGIPRPSARPCLCTGSVCVPVFSRH